MNKKLVVTTALWLGLVVNLIAQTVSDVLEKHIQAMGGAEKLSTLQTLKMNSTFQLSGMDVSQNTTVINNKAFRQETNLQGMNIIQAILDNKGWTINPLMGQKDPAPLPDDMVLLMKDQMDLSGALINSKEKGHTVELIGNEKIEATDTYKLKVTKKDGSVDYYYLDQKTYLPIKTVASRKVQGQDFKQEISLSNYQQVDGLAFPYSMSVKSDMMPGGTPMVITVKKIEVNSDVKEDIFKMPAKN